MRCARHVKEVQLQNILSNSVDILPRSSSNQEPANNASKGHMSTIKYLPTACHLYLSIQHYLLSRMNASRKIRQSIRIRAVQAYQTLRVSLSIDCDQISKGRDFVGFSAQHGIMVVRSY